MITGIVLLALAFVMLIFTIAMYLDGKARKHIFAALCSVGIFAILGAAIIDKQMGRDCSAETEMVDQ